jgi:hypothetical protein
MDVAIVFLTGCLVMAAILFVVIVWVTSGGGKGGGRYE